MQFRWYGIVLNMILAALVISGAVFYAAFFQGRSGESRVLEMRDAASGKLYGKWPLKGGEEFALEFIHSVHQSPVREIFTIEGSMICPVAARFSAFGAGMQSDLEEGQILSRDGDVLVITGFNSAFTELRYIVGTVSDHLLFIMGETVSLSALCGKNAHIVLRITGGKNR